MRDSPKEWYAATFDQDRLDQLVNEFVAKNGYPPPSIWLSQDIWIDMQVHQGVGASSIPGFSILKFWTSAGSIPVEMTVQYNHMMFVGSREALDRLEWDAIDKEFEKEFLDESSAHVPTGNTTESK